MRHHSTQAWPNWIYKILKPQLTPFVMASGEEAEEAGWLNLPSSPLDLGREAEDLGREPPLIPGIG